jgi:hypothetical protein
MEITVINYFREGEVTKIEGEAAEVENKLRLEFKPLFFHVPSGDLDSILDELSRVYGLEVVVKGFTAVPRVHKETISSSDPRGGELEVTHFWKKP